MALASEIPLLSALVLNSGFKADLVALAAMAMALFKVIPACL